ncbi:MAG: 50S ribosomal protein L32 [Desulfobacterales bacterium]|jgi:large subunit ribosomal protein L32|nr:50S ribosomal protein L32 [Desulfobacterales bacterium]
MGLPKRRTSKSRRDKRRTGKRLSAPSLSTCPDCSEPVLPHHACSSCGSYKGRQVTNVEKE